MEHSSSHLLSVILFTPLVGALLLLFIPRESQILHRLVGNLFGALGFLVSLPLVLHFPAGSSGYEFKESIEWIPSIGATYSLGADGINVLLVMLTTFLGMIAIAFSWDAIRQRTKEIQNEDIRKEAEKRLAKRRKSYGKILTTMEEAKEQFVPLMSDLNDVRKLLESELSASTVASTKSLIRQANWHGEDVRDSLSDVEKELDRVSAELAKYQ